MIKLSRFVHELLDPLLQPARGRGRIHRDPELFSCQQGLAFFHQNRCERQVTFWRVFVPVKCSPRFIFRRIQLASSQHDKCHAGVWRRISRSVPD